jgi:hypothetical protein
LKEKIIAFIRSQGEASPKEIADYFGLSRQMTHRYLKALLGQGKLEKMGLPPKVFYQAKAHHNISPEGLDAEDAEWLQKNFIEITNRGQLLEGQEAFKYWCSKRNQPFAKTLAEYKSTQKKYAAYFKNGLISGSNKLENTKGFSKTYLTDVFYLDFYAIERFGKTVLGKLIHFGKQSQSTRLLKIIVSRTKEKVLELVKTLRVDAVGYIPPTINRQVQIMSVLEKDYNLPLPHLQLVKIKGEIIVPQKALSKISDRIENTQQSIMVADKRQFEKVLLIDDAIGSGATLNETAAKLLRKGVARQVYGLAITGSYKGFEVITEA